MQGAEDAAVHRMISKVMMLVLIENGVINRDDAIAGFREAKRQIAASALDGELRQRMVREIESLLRSLETGAMQRVH